jgi:hypothetical protein
MPPAEPAVGGDGPSTRSGPLFGNLGSGDIPPSWMEGVRAIVRARRPHPGGQRKSDDIHSMQADTPSASQTPHR